MKRLNLPTQNRLKELFDYDAETGFLTRKVRVKGWLIGSRAGCRDSTKGHRRIHIDGVNYRETNVIWKWVTGQDPVCIIDHKDLVSDNNQWSNLREATISQNTANMRARCDNLLGVKGITARGDRFGAQIKGPSGMIWLGTFDTIEEAKAAHIAKAIEIYGEFARAA